MSNIIKGILYKKTKGDDGKLSKRIPFLPKTLSKLVIREDGTSVEDALKKIDDIKGDGKSYTTFNSKKEYDDARQNGTIGEGELAVVFKENN